jgi:D-arabinose 1-dehydrogenase-like Zn-dependent alcohol dehydrogenase
MKATCWYDQKDIRVEEVPDPTILDPRDAVVKITSSAICGSDLHLYNGFIPTMEKGDILGHEFMGEVVEIGPEVKKLNVGDRVVVAFPIACGSCFFCKPSCIRSAKTRTQTRPSRKSCGVIHRAASSVTRMPPVATREGRRNTRGCHSRTSARSKSRTT